MPRTILKARLTACFLSQGQHGNCMARLIVPKKLISRLSKNPKVIACYLFGSSMKNRAKANETMGKPTADQRTGAVALSHRRASR